MLNQLLDNLSELRTIEEQFSEINDRAGKIPETKEEIKELAVLTTFKLDVDQFPMLALPEIMVMAQKCKQVLVETGDYFYI